MAQLFQQTLRNGSSAGISAIFVFPMMGTHTSSMTIASSLLLGGIAATCVCDGRCGHIKAHFTVPRFDL